MYSLVKTLELHAAGAKDDNVDRDQFEMLMTDVIRAASYHVNGSHITIGTRRLEVHWIASEQRFVDWGNNFWMYGPESTHGNGKWKLGARHDREVIVESILNRAAHATKFDRVDRLWNFYWQLMLQDIMQNAEGEMIDLHINPLDVSKLAGRPEPVRREPVREPDYIRV